MPRERPEDHEAPRACEIDELRTIHGIRYREWLVSDIQDVGDELRSVPILVQPGDRRARLDAVGEQSEKSFVGGGRNDDIVLDKPEDFTICEGAETVVGLCEETGDIILMILLCVPAQREGEANDCRAAEMVREVIHDVPQKRFHSLRSVVEEDQLWTFPFRTSSPKCPCDGLHPLREEP